MQPRSRADFLILYQELAVWWGSEQAKIDAEQGLTGRLTTSPSLLTPAAAHLIHRPPIFHPQMRSDMRRGGSCWPRRHSYCRP